MNTEKQLDPIPQPQLIKSLRAGFDAVATHIGLILFPVVLDLFLWFGPHFQLKTIFERMIQELNSLPGMNTAQMSELIKSSQESWKFMGDHFNLAAALRTYPVGIPSLMTGNMPLETPIGKPMLMDVHSLGQAALGWLIFTILGLIFGSLYFGAVARVINPDNIPFGTLAGLWDALQVILLSVSVLILFAIINIPAVLLLSLLALVSPAIAQVAVILFSLLLIWILIPLLFSPHGIFIYRQNALRSMLTSVRLVRYILPGTGLFFLTILVLSQGFDLLWQVPPANSWMGLVGIAGHAFITTGLLAASFVYYQDAMRWVQEFLQRNLLSRSRISQI